VEDPSMGYKSIAVYAGYNAMPGHVLDVRSSMFIFSAFFLLRLRLRRTYPSSAVASLHVQGSRLITTVPFSLCAFLALHSFSDAGVPFFPLASPCRRRTRRRQKEVLLEMAGCDDKCGGSSSANGCSCHGSQSAFSADGTS
ncbi:MAG: hypothetical protein QNK28_08275, partial [Desulfobacterales bacterium]|nr:hypothetical protein [Desulfobacterales bacterium]